MAWDEGLRDEQRTVADASRSHLVLLAGPGTGKTFVLVRRIQYLVENEDISPAQITALTFTRAAAAEMRGRLEERLGDVGRRVRVSTLHAYALREILKQGAGGLPMPLRVVGDWEERWIVVQELAKRLGRNVGEISNSRGDGALDRLADDWDTLAADGAGWEEGHADPAFLGAWRRHREVYGYTLRSELVYQLLVELRTNSSFSPGGNTQVLLVDEYQDLNRCDLNTIQMLAERADAEVMAAGDDDQSIYSFRHAHPAGIRGFANEYSGAVQLIMTECLRCGQAVVDIANWLIEQETGRTPKSLVSVTDWNAAVLLLRFQNQNTEAAAVARVIEREVALGTSAEEILVVMKSDTQNRVSDALTSQLGNLEIETYLPRAREASVGLQRLLEFLLLSQAAAADEIDNVALRSLLELESNGIGATRIDRIAKFAYENGWRFNVAIDEALARPQEFSPGTWNAFFNEIDRLLEVARSLVQGEEEEFEDWLFRVARTLDVDAEDLEILLQASAQVAAQHVDEVVGAGAEEAGDSSAKAAPIRDYLTDLVTALTGLGDALPSHVEGKVTVTTMHGAKGLSADVVIVLQAEDEVIPGAAVGSDEDEARRLLYVSLTRARKKLIITACDRRTGPQRFVGQDEVVQRTFTRFLRDYGLTAYDLKGYLEVTPLNGDGVKGE